MPHSHSPHPPALTTARTTQGMLAPAELDLLCGAHCPSSFALGVLSQLVVSAPVGDSQLARSAGVMLWGDAGVPLTTPHTAWRMLTWQTYEPHCGGTLPTQHRCPQQDYSMCSFFYLCRLDENLTLLGDAAGTCQQLLHTPIPLSYTR